MRVYDLRDYAKKAIKINSGLYMPSSKGLQFITKLNEYDSDKCHFYHKEKDIMKVYEVEDGVDVDFNTVDKVVWDKKPRTVNDEFEDVFNIGKYQVVRGLDGKLFFGVGSYLIRGHMEYDMTNVCVTDDGQIFLKLTEEARMKYGTQNDMVKIKFVNEGLGCIVGVDEKLYEFDDFTVLPIDILNDINKEGYLPKGIVFAYQDKIKPIIEVNGVDKVQIMGLKDFCLNRNVFDVKEDRVCFLKEDKSVGYINRDLFNQYGKELVAINKFTETFGAVEIEDGAYLPTCMIQNYPSVIEMYQIKEQMKEEKKKKSFRISNDVIINGKEKGTIIDVDLSDNTYRVVLDNGGVVWYQEEELELREGDFNE